MGGEGRMMARYRGGGRGGENDGEVSRGWEGRGE